MGFSLAWLAVRDVPMDTVLGHLELAATDERIGYAIRERFVALQEDDGGLESDVDFYFEIPTVLAQSYVGFKHDEVYTRDTDGKFLVLNDLRPPMTRAKAWWHFWK